MAEKIVREKIHQKSRDDLACQLRFLRNLEDKETFVNDFLQGKDNIMDVFCKSDKIMEEYLNSLWKGKELDNKTKKKIKKFREDVLRILLNFKYSGERENLARKFLNSKKCKEEYIEALWKHRKLDEETQERLLDLEECGLIETDLIISHVDNFDKEVLTKEILRKMILKKVRDEFWEKFYYAAWYSELDEELVENYTEEVDYNYLGRLSDEGLEFLDSSADDLMDYFISLFEITDEDAKDIISKYINRFCRMRDIKKSEKSWSFYIDYQWAKYWVEKTNNPVAKKDFKRLKEEVDDR